MTNTESQVKEIVGRVLVRGDSALPGTAKLVEDLGVSSLDRFELIMALEDEFELEVPQDAQDTLVTIDDIVRYIDSHLQP